MIRKLFVLSLAFALIVPGAAFADADFQLGVPGRNFPDDESVDGMRLSILWGKNQQTSGFDLGLFSVSQAHVRSGFALVGGISRVTGKSDGAANLSFMNYHSGEDRGANLAFEHGQRHARRLQPGLRPDREGADLGRRRGAERL